MTEKEQILKERIVRYFEGFMDSFAESLPPESDYEWGFQEGQEELLGTIISDLKTLLEVV